MTIQRVNKVLTGFQFKILTSCMQTKLIEGVKEY